MHTAFIDACCTHLGEQGVERIVSCLEQLDEEQIWAKPNEATNSIGNLCLHLAGNVRQWIISALGGEADRRDRDGEFSAIGGQDATSLIDGLRETVSRAQTILRGLTPEQLAGDMRVQGFDTNATGAVVHVVEHFSYHTGQISLLTKLMRGQDLGYYAGRDLNQHNKPE